MAWNYSKYNLTDLFHHFECFSFQPVSFDVLLSTFFYSQLALDYFRRSPRSTFSFRYSSLTILFVSTISLFDIFLFAMPLFGNFFAVFLFDHFLFDVFLQDLKRFCMSSHSCWRYFANVYVYIIYAYIRFDVHPSNCAGKTVIAW